MSQRPHVGCRIPTEWHIQIVSICEATGQTPSEVLQEAIALYLKKVKSPKVKSRLDALEERITKLAALIVQ